MRVRVKGERREGREGEGIVCVMMDLVFWKGEDGNICGKEGENIKI